MIDHVGSNCADLAASETFDDRVLGTWGFSRQMDFDVAVGYGAATELGAETLHAPRLWPEYHEHYVGSFVRDPDD
jgi:hypothetical protein